MNDGLVFLRRGDVIENSGQEYQVVMVNDCRALAKPITGVKRLAHFNWSGGRKVDNVKEIIHYGNPINISCRVEPCYILRHETITHIETNQVGEKGKMSKKDKSKEVKEEKKPSAGKLGGVFGFSTTSVLRALGADDVSTEWAAAIMEARGIKLSRSTVSIQVCAGRNKDEDRGEPAALTGVQLKELKSSVEDPEKVREREAKAAAEAEKEAKAAAKAEKEKVAA